MPEQLLLSEKREVEFLTQRELATRWKISVRTLERWRGEHYGPAWLNIGGSIRYSSADVQAFEANHKRIGCGANGLGLMLHK